jgi:hypothetical protein
MIDHGRSFQWHKEIEEPIHLTRGDRALLARRGKIVGMFGQKGEPALCERHRCTL